MEYIFKNKIFFILLLTAVLLETVVFNFRFYESLFFENTVLENPVHSDGITKYSDTKYYVRKDGDKYLEFDNINCNIKNIYIDIKRQNYDRITDKQKTNIVIRATDDANENYYDLPERSIIADVERSKYIRLNLLGETKKIQIVLKNLSDDEITVNEISVNKPLFFEFNVLRFIIVFAVLVVFYLLRPKSDVYKIIFDNKSIPQLGGVFIILSINALIISNFVFSNPSFNNTTLKPHLQYHRLTEAITDGHFYLDEEPSESLKQMENPYDTSKRRELNTKYEWDHAYYNGKYYVYFGITPVLLFYLPFYAVTGSHINNEYVIYITAFIFMFSVFLLIREIINRWFKKIPYCMYLILSELMFLSSGAVFPIKRPDIYFVPVFMAMALAILGLYLWISSVKEKKDGKKYFIKWRLLFGSICMALIAGCRPQVLLAAFLSVPLFWNLVFKERKLFSKKSISDTLVFIMPFIVFAAFIMYYNFARFGSPFDFGANYNLTTNDMTKRGFILGRIPTGIFMYLFQPAVYTPKFPFIASVNFYTNFMGMTVKEFMFGGAFANHLILLMLLFVFRLKKYLKRKNLYYFVLSSVVFAFIIVIADTEMAGLLQRYCVDFTWFLFLGAVICILMILEKFKDTKYYSEICCLICLLCGLSFLYDSAAFFFLGDYSTADKNPAFYYSVMHAVQFWL